MPRLHLRIVRSNGLPSLEPSYPVSRWHDDLDEQLEISNHVNDLVHEGRLDEAEELCHELKRRWPDMIDWRDRFAQIYEARGDNARAAEH